MWSVLCLFTKKYWMYSKKGEKSKNSEAGFFFSFIIQRKHGSVVRLGNGAKGNFFKNLFSKQVEDQADYHQKTLPLQSCSYGHYDYDDEREKNIYIFHTGVLVVYRKTLGLWWVCISLFWRVGFRNIWGGGAVITWQLFPLPCCEMGAAYRKSPYLWLWGLGAETSSLLQSWPYFVYWIFVLFTFCLFFIFFHSGFKYFFIQRKKKCSWGG